MYCIILFPDATGRMPTAQELRQRGFAISTAVELPELPLAAGIAPGDLGRSGQAAVQGVVMVTRADALAAEELAPYGVARSLEL